MLVAATKSYCMKRILCSIALYIIPLFTWAQEYNPYVSNGSISPTPIIYPSGTAQFTFTFGNSGTSDIDVLSSPLRISISLALGELQGASVVQSISGSMANSFNWVYDLNSQTVRGQQTATIPANTSGQIIIDYTPTSTSTQASPFNGFNVNVIPPVYTGATNILSDDNVSYFTWTLLTPAPAELKVFNGLVRVRYNELNWSTISENNVKEFELYHGLKISDMSKIATIPTKAENNSSNQPLGYTFKHLETAVGTNYYKLATVDLDGSRKYYNTISLVNDKQRSNWLIGPNPTKDHLLITYNHGDLDLVHLTLSDILGKVIYRKKIVFEGGHFSEIINTCSFPNGVYILNITDLEGYNYSQRILKN